MLLKLAVHIQNIALAVIIITNIDDLITRNAKIPL